MQCICSNNNLFCGDKTSRSLCHNIPELMKRTYFYVGAIISTSLVHGGPAPAFFVMQLPIT